MAWLIGLGDRIVPGTALFVVANAGLLFATLAAMVWTRPRVSWLAPVLAGAMVFSPLLLVYQAIVWKDVLFADTAVTGFVWLSIGAGLTGAKRIAAPVFAFLLFTVAAMTRQNGAIVVPVGAAALFVIILRQQGRGALRRALMLTAAALVLPLGLAVVGQAVFASYKVEEAGPAGELRTLQFFDIVGALKHDQSIDLTPFGESAAHVRAALSVYTPTRVDTLAHLPGIDEIVGDPDEVPAVWRDVVLHHTRAYLAHRTDAFLWTIAQPRIERCLPVAVGVNGPAEELHELGMGLRYTAQDKRMATYTARFFGTPVFSHLAYIVLALAMGLVLLRSRDPRDAPILAMIVAMAVFAASFTLISLACDYRYLYPVDLAAMAAALYLACGMHVGPMANPAA
jgi:hypothetical protein